MIRYQLMGQITLGIVSERLWQEALANLLSPDENFCVITSVSRVEDLCDVCNRPPDVVLIDFDSPENVGGGCVKRVKDVFPQCAVIGVSSRIRSACLISTMEAGMAGCLLKTATREQLIRAIMDVLNNQAIIDLAALRAALGQLIKEHKEVGPGKELTSQELRVMRLVAEALSNKQIGKRMSISDRTVSTHLRNIFFKLEVASRMEAVLYVMRAGWID